MDQLIKSYKKFYFSDMTYALVFTQKSFINQVCVPGLVGLITSTRDSTKFCSFYGKGKFFKDAHGHMGLICDSVTDPNPYGEVPSNPNPSHPEDTCHLNDPKLAHFCPFLGLLIWLLSPMCL